MHAWSLSQVTSPDSVGSAQPDCSMPWFGTVVLPECFMPLCALFDIWCGATRSVAGCRVFPSTPFQLRSSRQHPRNWWRRSSWRWSALEKPSECRATAATADCDGISCLFLCRCLFWKSVSVRLRALPHIPVLQAFLCSSASCLSPSSHSEQCWWWLLRCAASC